jgi:benzoylformate decarboxylase
MNRVNTEFLSGTKLQTQTVSEVVFDFLRQQGMNRVFGNPGSTELPMFVNLPADFSYVLGLQESVVVANGRCLCAGDTRRCFCEPALGRGPRPRAR